LLENHENKINELGLDRFSAKTVAKLVASAGHLRCLKVICESEHTSDLIDNLITTAECAVEGGQLECLKYLCDHHANKLKPITGSPFFWLANDAAEHNQLECLKYFCEQKRVKNISWLVYTSAKHDNLKCYKYLYTTYSERIDQLWRLIAQAEREQAKTCLRYLKKIEEEKWFFDPDRNCNIQ